MPGMNVYVSEKEYEALLAEAKRLRIRVPLLIRKIVREWLIDQGYGVE